MNPSLSFTLTHAHTTTEVAYRPASTAKPLVEFLFEGRHRPDFSERIEAYADVLKEHFPVLKGCDFVIRSENSFPHSTGIASSASAMSALALCFASVAYAVERKPIDQGFWPEVSHLARLGSGSACRSVLGPVTVWGAAEKVSGSSDEYAVRIADVHPRFHSLRDTILIVDTGPKSVSSSAGHQLMHGHPYAKTRFDQARQNLVALIEAIAQGDFARFIQITEHEALSLHAMMMTSSPGYLLLKPGTLHIIEKVRQARREEHLPVCFTLDAGPNVHLLYPDDAEQRVRAWIDGELSQHCQDGSMIHDQAGRGPEQLNVT